MLCCFSVIAFRVKNARFQIQQKNHCAAIVEICREKSVIVLLTKSKMKITHKSATKTRSETLSNEGKKSVASTTFATVKRDFL